MEVLGTWNKISEKLRKEIPTLKSGQAVKFQMLNGSKNISTDNAEERARQPMIYPKSNIILKDRIWDPYVTDSTGKEVGGFVNIGIWQELDEKGNPQKFVSFLPWENGRHPFDGVFHMIGGMGDNDVWFEFFFLSTLRKDGINLKKKIEPEFDMIDPMKISKSNTKTANALRDALVAVDNMNLSEKKDFAASMLWPCADWDNDMLDGELNKMAMEHSKLFMQKYGDPYLKTKTLIGKCAQLGLIVFDGKNKVTFGNSGVILASITIDTGKSWVDAVADFIKTSKNGPKAEASLKKQLEEFAPAVEVED